MTATFESARAKINRAKWLFNQLNDQIESDASRKYGVNLRRELKTNELVLTALRPPHDLFVQYSVIGSEIIGHARSALDHAVWELTPIGDRSKQTAFPVFRFQTRADTLKRSDGYYEGNGLRKIKGVNAKAAAIIKAAQPFGPDYERKEPYILNQLWNVDKHRLLNFCAAYTDLVALTDMPLPLGSAKFSQRFVGIPRDVKDGTELFREPYSPNVEVVAEAGTTGVIFDGGPADRQRVQDLLWKLIDFSDKTIEALAKTA